MRSLKASLLYPCVAMLHVAIIDYVGSHTEAQSQLTGAYWIQGPILAEYLNSRFIPGVRVYATRFRPTSSNFAGEDVEGVRFVVTDRETFDSTRLGIELAGALERLFPGKPDFEKCRFLVGSRET